MSNIRPRIIPLLQIRDSQLYKSFKYSKYKYIGDPINAARIFNEKSADELSIVDIEASKKNKPPNFNLISDITSECFMPISYGGGIKTIDEARKIFKLGVEKIIIKTAFYENPIFIKKLSDTFGSQSIVVSIDYRKSRLTRKYVSVNNYNSKYQNRSPIEDVKLAIKLGAGEVILNNTQNDGTFFGMNNDLIEELKTNINIPILNMGGCKDLEDMRNTINLGYAGVLVGSLFVFHGVHNAVLISYPSTKEIDNLLKK